MFARHAHAAAGTWSSSKPSNAGDSRAPRRIASHRPGRPRHDPAWLALTAHRKSCASGDDAAHVGTFADRADDHFKPRSWSPATRHVAPAPHVPTHRCASHPSVCPPHDRAKTEIPIGNARGPRLPALEDIVRLPASDILHRIRRSRAIFGAPTSAARSDQRYELRGRSIRPPTGIRWLRHFRSDWRLNKPDQRSIRIDQRSNDPAPRFLFWRMYPWPAFGSFGHTAR